LKDKSLFIEKSYVNGEWVGAESGKTFEVHGEHCLAVLEDLGLTVCFYDNKIHPMASSLALARSSRLPTQKKPFKLLLPHSPVSARRSLESVPGCCEDGIN
jgi:hypothetical protein